MLFSDDFEGVEPAKVWHRVAATIEVEQGVLKGTQTQGMTVSAGDGKPAVNAPAAVHGPAIATKDSGAGGEDSF
ncbi:MAG: hypothetical protein WD768_06605 [Phycisphaeraceae bacterium]